MVMEFFEPYILMAPKVLQPYLVQALPVWISGGWAMIPLAVTGLIMYTMGFSCLFQLLILGARHAPEHAWRVWLKRPTASAPLNPLRRIISDAMKCGSLHEIEIFFSLLMSEGVNPFAHRLQVMKVCVTCAPLLGLLGTVTGMLVTFGGLAKGGGDQTMDIISKGIAEALITTETGLVVALTGVMIHFFLVRQQQRYEMAVTHIQTLCMSEFQQREHAQQTKEMP
jgi:biopolymer transport protein ExbB